MLWKTPRDFRNHRSILAICWCDRCVVVCAFCVPSALLQRRLQCGEPVDKNELDHAEPAERASNNAIEQMVLDEEDSPPFLNVSDAGVPVGLAVYEER